MQKDLAVKEDMDFLSLVKRKVVRGGSKDYQGQTLSSLHIDDIRT